MLLLNLDQAMSKQVTHQRYGAGFCITKVSFWEGAASPVVCPWAVGVISIVRVGEVGNPTSSKICPHAVVDGALKGSHGIEGVVNHVVAVQVGSHV